MTVGQQAPLTVVIPTLDNAADLARSLDSISWASEIFVVDSLSKDETRGIAESRGAKVASFIFNGKWPKKLNWALENLTFSNDWVLILRPDEVVPPEAKDEITDICLRNPKGFQGYRIKGLYFFMGRWLTHTRKPDWEIRLFLHRKGRYEALTEDLKGSGDTEIYEPLALQGKAGVLKAELKRYTFRNTQQFIEKHNRYSNWEARVEYAESEILRSLLDRKTKKEGMGRLWQIIWHRMPFRPFLKFFYLYFLRGGFLDGERGYYFARLHQFYEFLSLCKLYELRKNLRKAAQEKMQAGKTP